MKEAPTEQLHIFLDNSNVWIEGQRVAAGGSPDDDRMDSSYRIDFGRLMNLVRRDREIAEANLYGSEPPPNDSVWRVATERGFRPKVFQRNFKNREKKVDTQLCVDATKSMYSHHPKGRVLVLIAGDADYMPAIEVALQRGWRAEVCFWANANRELRTDKRFTFTDLTPHALDIGFRA
jgi:uncharacterized LabA/DUF88 family protein